jgi:hypothetical protein
VKYLTKSAMVVAVNCLIVGGALAGIGPAAAEEASGVVTLRGTCGDSLSPSVGGGAAAWNLTCASGKIRVQGWVKDTDADGKAAEVYGTWEDGSSFGTVRAGGEGTIKRFDKAHRGSHVYLRLRVI